MFDVGELFDLICRDDDLNEKNRSIVNATIVLRLLYDLAVDSYDRAPTLPVCCTTTSKIATLPPSRSQDGTLRRPLNLNPGNSLHPDPILVHPGVVLAMFQLLPSIWVEEDIQVLTLIATNFFSPQIKLKL